MAMIIAILIIGLISLISISFRAYSIFNLLLIGLALIISVLVGGDKMFLMPGLVMFVGGLSILFITSLQVHGQARGRHILHILMYGLFLFLKVLMICLIVTIPLLGMVNAICKSYRQVCLADGGKVYVDEDLRGTDGRQYERIRR